VKWAEEIDVAYSWKMVWLSHILNFRLADNKGSSAETPLDLAVFQEM